MKWSPDRVYGYDEETYLISRGRLAPRLVCGSFSNAQESWVEEAWNREDNSHRMVETLRGFLKKDILLVGHNLAFDTVVACCYDQSLIRPIFEAYRDGRFACTKIRQSLLDIAEGTFRGKYEEDGSWTPQRYGLADLCERYGLRQLDKSADSYRLRYNELDGMVASRYPEAAYQYAAEDARATREVYLCQQRLAPEGVLNENEQCRAHFALQLASVWGIRTDKTKVDEIERQLTAEATALKAKMAQHGVFRPDGTKDTKVLKRLVTEAFERQGLPVPMTEKGSVKTDADTLNLSGDELLQTLGEGGGPLKLLTSFVPAIKGGVDVPLQPGYEVMVVTGRTSSKSPTKRKKGEIPIGLNIQQMPRDRRDENGEVTLGIRNCFVPRPGHYFSSVDYSVAELRALAEVHYQLFGHSALRDTFIKKLDPHLVMASSLLDKPVDWVVSNKDTLEVHDARQEAKPAGFGLPGGLGVESFIEFSRANYGRIFSVDRAKVIIKKYHETIPEQKQLFDYVKQKIGPTEGTITQLIGAPIQHGLRSFTKACNLLFQGPIAQISKEALWRVQWECYLGDDGWRGAQYSEKSWLYNSRVVAFIHDEILAELQIEYSDQAARRLAKVMCDTMSEFLPNVPAVAEPALCECWDKAMEPVYVDENGQVTKDKNGKLVPWRREVKVKKEEKAA